MGLALLAGRFIATAVSPVDSRHITVRFSAKRPPRGDEQRWRVCDLAEATKVYVDVPARDLAPGDNVGALVVEDGRVVGLVHRHDVDERRRNAALYACLVAAGRLDGSKIQQSTHCYRCGHPDLTDPVSIQRGLGPVCFGKVTGSQHERRKIDEFPAQTLAHLTRAAQAQRAADASQAEPDAPQTSGAAAAPPPSQEPSGFVSLAPGQDPRDLARR